MSRPPLPPIVLPPLQVVGAAKELAIIAGPSNATLFFRGRILGFLKNIGRFAIPSIYTTSKVGVTDTSALIVSAISPFIPIALQTKASTFTH